MQEEVKKICIFVTHDMLRSSGMIMDETTITEEKKVVGTGNTRTFLSL